MASAENTIDVEPRADQIITHEGANFTTIKEGLAYILVPQGTPTSTDPKAPKEDADKQSVFYNPIQQFNRDLSVLAIRAFGEDFVAAQKLKRDANKPAKKEKAERRKQKKRDIKAGLNNKEESAGGLHNAAKRRKIDGNGLHENGANDVGSGTAGKEGISHQVATEQLGIGLAMEDSAHSPRGQELLQSTTSLAQAQKSSAPSSQPSYGAGLGETAAANTPDTVPSTEGPEAEIKTLIDRMSEPNEANPPLITKFWEQERTDFAQRQEALASNPGNASLHEPGKLSNQQRSSESTASGSNGTTPLFKPDFRILDALSATGLRALRYAQEIPFATAITANDMSRKATESIALNVQHNKLTKKITTNAGNAISHMYNFVGIRGYDVIDLDPYGTAAPFLDSALQALTNGGLLCVTCTDSGVFNSTGYLEKTYSQYGGLPIKGFHSHEGGLRLILHAIATSAARYGLAIEPLLSLSIDYYARVFVRVRKSPAEVKFLAGKTMIVYNCDAGCGAWQTQFLARNIPRENRDGTLYYKHSFAQGPSASPLCEHCGTKSHLSGPMYGGPLHNPAFIERILSYLSHISKDTCGTTARIEGMLQTAYEETLVEMPHLSKRKEKPKAAEPQSDTGLEGDDDQFIPQMDPAQVDHHPFYFTPSTLARVVRCQAPSDAAIRGALRHAGFRATRSHCKPGTIRTNASWTDLWYIMREWVRQKAPVKKGSLSESSAGWKILNTADIKNEGDDGDQDVGAPPEDEDAGEGAVKTARRHNYEVVFDEALGRDAGPKLMRYQLNPRANWGPMTRAK